jgi:hypothetical protein
MGGGGEVSAPEEGGPAPAPAGPGPAGEAPRPRSASGLGHGEEAPPLKTYFLAYAMIFAGVIGLGLLLVLAMKLMR